MQISWSHRIWTIDQSTASIWYVFFVEFKIFIVSTFLSERNYLLECSVQVLDKDASCENYDFDSLEEEEIFERTVGKIKANYFGKPRNTNDMFNIGAERTCGAKYLFSQ